MKRSGLSPLGKWLLSSGVRQEDFAKMLEAVRETPTSQSQVSSWATGSIRPVASTIVAIEKATGKAVKRSAWRRRK